MIYIVPIFILVTFCYSVYKGSNTYSSFVCGVRESLSLVVSVFPYIFAVFVLIELFKISGLSIVLTNIVSPLFNLLGIPSELIDLILIKYFSGSGSIAALIDVYHTYGVDSYISRVASCIVGSSEAIFYIVAVYFANTKVVKFRYGIVISLIASFVGIIVASFICKYI